jgi:hypothetical protein
VDLAKYCVNAVLVEGRSLRAVAAATGRSKSWVQRHVALYQAGGDEALTVRKRGPKVPPNLNRLWLLGDSIPLKGRWSHANREDPAEAVRAALHTR